MFQVLVTASAARHRAVIPTTAARAALRPMTVRVRRTAEIPPTRVPVVRVPATTVRATAPHAAPIHPANRPALRAAVPLVAVAAVEALAAEVVAVEEAAAVEVVAADAEQIFLPPTVRRNIFFLKQKTSKQNTRRI